MLHYLKTLQRRMRLHAAQQLFGGPDAWWALDQMKIPGFGTELIRFLYPISPLKEGDQQAHYPAIDNRLKTQQADFDIWLQRMQELQEVPQQWPLNAQTDSGLPSLDNQFFGCMDMLALLAMIRHYKPQTYLEIGSGNSTRIARFAADQYHPSMQIHCIDPAPRAEISQIATEVTQAPFSKDHLNRILSLKSGDILFFDGSHISLPGSDVTFFFMEVLPQIPSGVVVHIHDIYLPYDYPAQVRHQMWSEQYLLGQWIMGGGSGYDILYPAAFAYQSSVAQEILLEFQSFLTAQKPKFPEIHQVACSFWMQRNPPAENTP